MLYLYYIKRTKGDKMKAYKWTQTIIDFETYHKSKLEIEYHKTYKSMNRFYLISFYNKFKNKDFDKWFSNFKRIEKKIGKREAIHRYISKMWLSV